MTEQSKMILGRKRLFDSILTEALSTSAFRVEAAFETVNSRQLVSARVCGENGLQLKINLSFREDSMLADCEKSMDLTVIYRAYAIAAYVRCLEGAMAAVPGNYFSGLVTVDALTDLSCGRTCVLHLPDGKGRNRILRPIDVHCANLAMANLLVRHGGELTREAKDSCEAYREILMDYMSLPEIQYEGRNRTVWTALRKAGELQALRTRPQVAGSALLSGWETSGWETMTVTQLLQTCGEENRFLPELLMRLTALKAGGFGSHLSAAEPCVQEAFQLFFQRAVELHRRAGGSLLLQENKAAVQRLARRLTGIAEPKGGAVHYLQ